MSIKTSVIILFILCLAQPALCEMGSANYRITTSVISGGGGTMSSSSYQMVSTLGQPSPLMDPSNPPYSLSYDLYPGFWYTLGAGTCEYINTFAASFGSVVGDANYCAACDFDKDGDVDGYDLSIVEFAP